jgi:hypothetical protein
MVFILARSHNARVLVEGKGDICLEGQAGPLEDDLGCEFVSHGSNYKRLGVLSVGCALWYDFPTNRSLMDDNITIIEGPLPVFEPVQDGWALSLGEGPYLPLTLLTRLRTFNGPALVERCYRRWRLNQSIHLHYRNDLGLEEKAPIVAARSINTDDGNVLLLWIQLDPQKVRLELDAGEDETDEE